jgi:hypothetical protein
MSMTYTIDPARQLVRTRAWGTLSALDLQDGTSRLMADERFDPGYHSLVDLTGVTAVSADLTALAEVAALPLFASDARRAIVATSDVAIGVARTYAAFLERSGSGGARLFDNAHDAEEWLGLA